MLMNINQIAICLTAGQSDGSALMVIGVSNVIPRQKAKEVSDSNTYRQVNLSTTRCVRNDIHAFSLDTGFHITIKFPIDCGS